MPQTFVVPARWLALRRACARRSPRRSPSGSTAACCSCRLPSDGPLHPAEYLDEVAAAHRGVPTETVAVEQPVRRRRDRVHPRRVRGSHRLHDEPRPRRLAVGVDRKRCRGSHAPRRPAGVARRAALSRRVRDGRAPHARVRRRLRGIGTTRARCARLGRPARSRSARGELSCIRSTSRARSTRTLSSIRSSNNSEARIARPRRCSRVATPKARWPTTPRSSRPRSSR